MTEKVGLKDFMIDFGLCHFRRECSDDNDWCWKATQDEQGDLARALGKELKEGFVYQRSARHQELELLDRKYLME